MTTAQIPKGTKRRSPDAEPSMLATLATISAQQLPTKDETPKEQPPIKEKRQRASTLEADPRKRHIPNTPVTEKQHSASLLELDPTTHLPAADIVDELLSHNTADTNIVGKIMQPKTFAADYRAGRVDAFLLLTCIANNVMYSQHTAVLRVGPVEAMRQLVSRARTLAPLALEQPSVSSSQALLLLAMAYMQLGRLDVASHYSSITLRMLQQLGVCTMDNSDCGVEDGWLHASWLEREQVRRVVWGGFTVDTFLSLMLHTTPYVLVDLSGVNRPCAPNMWYVGNDSLDSLSYPITAGRNPEDSEYLAAMREAKHGGLPWTLNGNTVQLNFAVLGNAMLRGISDPQASAEHVDRLVANARRAVDEWLAPLPLLPPQPTSAELAITLMVSAAALCLKSVITPYLFARCRAARNSPELGDLRGEAGIDVMMANYIDSAYAHYTHARRCSRNDMPPMFAAYSMMVCGGIFAACAHTAPTERLRRRFSAAMRFFADTAHLFSKKALLFQSAYEEIMAVANMARFLPRRLTEPQLRQIRDAMIPGSIEAVIGRPFSQFIAPIAPILRSSSSAEQPMRACRGVIPLTSNLCAIFGNVFGRPTSETPSKCSLPKSPLSKSPSPESTCVPDLVDEKVPDCRLSFTAVSSLMIGLAVAAKEELFFDFLPCDSKNDSSLNSILN